MKLLDHVKPISYLKANAADLVGRVAKGRRAFVITQRGEAKAILMDLTSYEALQDSVALLKIVALSARNMKKGRLKPLKRAFADVRRRIASRIHEAA